MKQLKIRRLFTIPAVLGCLLSTSIALSASDGVRLVALAMHQDTGRNIYIGALHYDESIPKPADIVAADGPKSMEYRVVARRTSIRSLMGSILLQGELATGTPPSANTSNFIGDVMEAVKGSLYTGDSLEIHLNSNNEVIAILDGQEIARSADRGVIDYLMMGWIGEGGPSTAFRADIVADEVNATLLPIYEAHSVSEERVAAVAGWNEDSSNETSKALVPVTNTPAATGTKVATTAVAANAVLTPVDTAPKPSQAALIEQPSPDTPAGKKINELSSQSPAAEPVQLASVTPTREMMQPALEDPKAEDVINAMEYAQRLASFNTHVLKSVYARIKYPKAAIRRNIQGVLELDLSVNKAGKLLDVAVAVSSGHSMLDKSAVKAAKRAFSDEPLAQIDQVAIEEYSEDGENLIIPIPVSFVLTD